MVQQDGGASAVTTANAHAAPVNGSERDRLLWMYKTMLRIRLFDDRIVRLFNSGRISGALALLRRRRSVSRPASARICVPTTTWSARTAATATCSPRAATWTA